MASSSELPLELFHEQSASFCASLRNDLDNFIGVIQNSFSSVNRSIKIAPKSRRKSKYSGTPSSCTLDLKQFTKSKQDVLHSLQSSLETMELKWHTEIAELKDWLLETVENSLSKVQLEVKVSAEDLNLSEAVQEIDLCEESSSSSSEVNITVGRRDAGRFSALMQPAFDVNKSSYYPQNRSFFHESSPHVSEVSPRNTSLLNYSTAAPLPSLSPPASINRTVKKVASGKTPTKKGKKSTQLSMKKKIIEEPSSASSSICEPAVKSKMSEWRSLIDAVENAPNKPGLYEIKVWRAKKPAYIGCSDDLQSCIAQYREGKPSGGKHLDQFILRNKGEISVRYEIHPSVQLAKLEQKKKLKEFLEKNKNLPSYNYSV